MNEKRKIRLALASDLHNEFEAHMGPRRPTAEWLELDQTRRAVQGHPHVGPLLDGLRGEGIDLVILAGDTDIGMRSIEYARQVSNFLGTKFVCVSGNHEAYHGRDLDQLLPEMRVAARETNGWVSFLENETVTFDFSGRRLHVLGCTLWTDYEANGNSTEDVSRAMSHAANGLNDHRRIFLGGRLLSPPMARDMHLQSRAWLASEVGRIRTEAGDDAEILIVTHHAPIPDGSGPQYTGGKLNPAFVSDMTGEITTWRPAVWVFGHTHYNRDTMIGGTRVLSAQRGYICSERGADRFMPKVISI